ncbi:hypothetical protein [Saccharopolyspora rosea]|uniref:Uncharacterized protein n=1 Tax=Saccharopolyspora rosea TaxID=524884 RepID=A0ABW3FMI3_9PSEU|nr:hypothetical protein [Saccharopolyspora rosea]
MTVVDSWAAVADSSWCRIALRATDRVRLAILAVHSGFPDS